MPGGSIEVTETETTKLVEKSDDCSTHSSDSCEKPACATYDASKIALWIVAIVLVLFWTFAIFACFSGWGDCDDDRDSCDRKKDCDNWGGFAAGFLVWLIVLVIFIAAVWACAWAAIIFFVILAILLGAAWWCSCSGKKKCDRRDDC